MIVEDIGHNLSGEMRGDNFLKFCDRTGHDMALAILKTPYCFTGDGVFSFKKQLCGEPYITTIINQINDGKSVTITFEAYDRNKVLCAIWTGTFWGKQKAFCSM